MPSWSRGVEGKKSWIIKGRKGKMTMLPNSPLNHTMPTTSSCACACVCEGLQYWACCADLVVGQRCAHVLRRKGVSQISRP
jgi:hypothetical protein